MVLLGSVANLAIGSYWELLMNSEQLVLFDLTPYNVQPEHTDKRILEEKVVVFKPLTYQQLELNLFPEEPKVDFRYSLIREAA